jgi:hypothetical protein
MQNGMLPTKKLIDFLLWFVYQPNQNISYHLQ